jgi:hypothetical protein
MTTPLQRTRPDEEVADRIILTLYARQLLEHPETREYISDRDVYVWKGLEVPGQVVAEVLAEKLR